VGKSMDLPTVLRGPGSLLRDTVGKIAS
jgi:hypothetical protein